MKKILTVIFIGLVLFGAAGCTKKTYTSEDIEVLELIETLDELKEDGGDENITIDYKVKDMGDKYQCTVIFIFGDHTMEMTTVQDSALAIKESLDTYEGSALWKFKIDGVEYDFDAASVLANHYYDTMAVD